MDSSERGALTLVRLIGVLLIIVSIMELGLYWAECSMPKNPQPVHVLPICLKSIPAVLGVVVLVKARAFAEWISNTLDL